MKKIALFICVVSAAACAHVPPAPPTPSSVTTVSASFSRTWDAVIDAFAERNVPIKTMDRSSGYIVSEEMQVPFESGKEHPWADCGKKMNMPQPPTHATYNVRVRGDSILSTVHVTAMWSEYNPLLKDRAQCSTKGVWEAGLQEKIRGMAED